MDPKEQKLKHDSLICFNLDSDSNVIDPIVFSFAASPAKHDLDRISTELGMQIECNGRNLKHDSLICVNLDLGSNVIDPILFW
jgi:hypothetical protein